MGSPLIVVGEEFGESLSALDRGGIGTVVGPAAQERLDKTFSFSVGAGSVRSGAQVAQAESSAGGCEAVRAIAGAVVGHDAGDFDAVAGVPGDEASKEGGSGWGSFVSQNFGVGQTGGIVDGDVNELPAGASGALPAVASDAVADDLDAAQLLDVDMNELARMVSLVAADGFLRVVESALHNLESAIVGNASQHAQQARASGVFDRRPISANH